MKGYLFRRILFSIFSLIVVTGTVMWMTYDLMDRNQIFANDQTYTHLAENEKVHYRHTRFVQLGYEDYINYGEYLGKEFIAKYGDSFMDNETAAAEYDVARNIIYENEGVTYDSNPYSKGFIDFYKKKGYKVEFYPKKVVLGIIKSQPQLIAYKQFSIFKRLLDFFGSMFSFETIYDVKDENLTDRYIRWEWDKRSNMPALVGSGTTHKYLIYFDNQFPFIHQNIFHLRLGNSVVSYQNVDVMDVLNMNTGEVYFTNQVYPVDMDTGKTTLTSRDFHSVTYSPYVSQADVAVFGTGERYTNTKQMTSGLTRVGNSFVIGILSVIICYIVGLPVGIWMARRKDKIVDKIGNGYIIFIMAVPSLAYIFAFAAIGVSMGLPLKWAQAPNMAIAMVLPVLSLALPAIGGLMKWMRRYMIDQSNADYVKFARSTGMTEGEIFRNHIARNAFIYLVHGVPGDILFALTGALVTERVYAVPGIGGLLTTAINKFDNGIIIGGTIFYAFLTILALILGDLLLVRYDPRVSLAERN